MKINFFEILKKKIISNKSKICIIGLGYVGLPLLSKFLKNNFFVIGYDIDKNKINLLKKKKTYIDYIKLDSADFKNFKPTFNLQEINKADVIIFCLPTPLNKNKEPDLSFIVKSLDNIYPYLKRGQLAILESTTYPGTTEEVIVNKLSKKFFVGENFFVGYSPEREDPGNLKFTLDNITKVVSGYSKKCLNLTDQLYSRIVKKTYRVSNLKTAEMTKLLENIYRAINIGLVNELKILSHRMGINIFEVIKAASTKPFGFQTFYPGPGLGGHCIPIDPFYLTWKAKEFDFNTKFIELAGEINSHMPNYVVNRLQEVFNKSKLSIFGKKILILGLSYKKNIDDIRESPSLRIIKLLLEKGCKVCYSDKFFKKIPHTTELKKNKIKNIYLNKKNLNLFDACIIVTDHDYYNYDFIRKNSKIIIDTRNVYNNKSKNVFSA
jgi:UDP-N-acetyl-D-glucosamine dehydrogenase